MIIVQNSIVSDDIADCRFRCDCAVCRGACCVEGDSGAPLLESEVDELERALPDVLPLLTPEGRDAIKAQGVAVRDTEGDLGTPLVEGGACAFAIPAPGGVTQCAFEKAHSDPQIPNSEFIKPVSCHLYPIRVEDYGEFTAVNYHRWEVCRAAIGQGEPLYIYLKEPLIRRFGNEWYDELVEQIKTKRKDEK